jgi:hypothetical protein
VEFTAALRMHLAALAAALEDPSADIEGSLRQLGADVKAAVDSYLGLSIGIHTGLHPVTLTVRDSASTFSEIASSLRIPLPLSATPGDGGDVILYAGRRGAFVDMAADLSWSIGSGLSKLVLDHHLGADLDGGMSGLKALSSINQAIGVLIGQGFTAGDALSELHARARAAGREVLAVADDIVAHASHPRDAPPR